MATGKYLSLEEARKKGKLKEFAKKHNKKGSMELFDKTLDRMVKKNPKASRTSKKD